MPEKVKKPLPDPKVLPIADRILIVPDDAEVVTAGGIIIPDSVQEKPQRGTVAIAGPGTDTNPMTCKRGDKVFYGKYAGTAISLKGEDYLIVRESDILCVDQENNEPEN